MAEIDLTRAEHDAALAIAALRDGHRIPAPQARALGHALGARLLTDAEIGAFAMLLALNPPPDATLADIARGLTHDTPAVVPGRVAWIADDAPTGSARAAVTLVTGHAGLDLVDAGSPPLFDRIAHGAGASSSILTALRAVYGACAVGASALLLDLHLDAALDLSAAQQSVDAIVAMGRECALDVAVRIFRFRAPLGRAFGTGVEPAEAAAVADGGGPVALRAFVAATLQEVGRLAGTTVTFGTPIGAAAAVAEPSSPTVRRELRATMDGSVLRLDPRIVVALSRLVRGIVVHHVTGDEVQRGDVILEVLGDDEASVERTAAAVNGAWAVGPGYAPPPTAEPVARVDSATHDPARELLGD